MNQADASRLEGIKRHLQSKGLATWGRSFDMISNAEQAAQWFDEQMTEYFNALDNQAPKASLTERQDNEPMIGESDD